MDDLKRVAGLGAETVEIVGDKGVDAAVIGAALDGHAPDLVLDFLWGGVAEAAFEALAEIPGAHATSYVEIGSAAGEQASAKSEKFVLAVEVPVERRRARVQGVGGLRSVSAWAPASSMSRKAVSMIRSTSIGAPAPMGGSRRPARPPVRTARDGR